MDPRTGDIHYFPDEEQRKKFEEMIGRKLIPLTEEQAKELKPLSKRKRKFLMRGKPCICGSDKSFKKCCWRKYRKKRKVA